MTAAERIAAAVALEKPDRTPVGPLLDHFAATYVGISKQEFMQNRKSRLRAILQTMRELGPWDLTFLAETAHPALLKGAPARVRWPGIDLPADEIHQFEEFELLTPEDYDLLLEQGVFALLQEVARRLYPQMGRWEGLKLAAGFAWEIRRHARSVRDAGAEPAVGFMLPGPLFEYFSLGRSLAQMNLDLYDRPEKIKAAGRRWAEDMTALAIRFARLVKIPRVFIGLSRSSPQLISPRHFQEFVWPELEYMVHHLIDAGLTPLFHCDTDWTKNFPLFQRLPPKKIILELDGFSDIFQAKALLGDRMCLMGDVPAYLTAFGTKDQVMAYCRRLLQEVGADGGFILSSGCSLPANAKPENVQALAEAVQEWG